MTIGSLSGMIALLRDTPLSINPTDLFLRSPIGRFCKPGLVIPCHATDILPCSGFSPVDHFGQNLEFVSKGLWVTFRILPILQVFTQHDNQTFVPSQSCELLNSIHDTGPGSFITPGK